MFETIFPFILLLFVLSQVSERISNFLKLNLPERFFGNLDIKEKVKVKEKIRERKIMFISLVAGSITSFLFYYSFFEYDTKTDDENFKNLKSYLSEFKFSSIILTTFFLSFGSKFWHDLLDIIFYYKNAQRSIQNGEVFQASSAEDIKAILELSSVKIALRALAVMKNDFMAIPGVVAVGIGNTLEEEPVLRVYFQEGTKAASISGERLWDDGSGVIRNIKIEKILSGPIFVQLARIGGKVAHKRHKKSFGTLGFVFKDFHRKDVYYTSTCYHVVKTEKHDWQSFNDTEPIDLCHLNQQEDCVEITSVKKGLRSDELDVALALLPSLKMIDLDSLPKVSRTAGVSEKFVDKKVTILTSNGPKTGYIHDWKVKVEVDYHDRSKQVFIDFFSIRLEASKSLNALRPVTEGGDSGSAVYVDDMALGMIVGGSNLLSYAMKISSVEKYYGVTLHPHPSFLTKSTIES